MHATIQAADLAAALKAGVASVNSPHDALRCAHLYTDDDAVVVETTDTLIYTRSRIPATVEGEGRLLLNAQMLVPVASGPGQIQLRATGEHQRGRSRYRIAPVDATIWPEQATGAWTRVAVDPVALQAAISSVSDAAIEDASPFAALRGIHLLDGLVWAADHVHVAIASIAYDGPAVVIPGGALRTVLPLLQEGAVVETATQQGATVAQAARLRVTLGAQQVTVRLFDAAPLGIRRIADAARSGEPITVRRAEFLAALRRFMPFAFVPGESAKKAMPIVIYELAGTQLSLSDRREESSEDATDALAEGTGKWRAALDPRRLVSAIQSIGGELLTIAPPVEKAKDVNPVWTIRPAGAEPGALTHYIAPMTI